MRYKKQCSEKIMKDNKKIITACVVSFLFLFVAGLHASEDQKHNFKPASGYVPDEETAIRIAVAVWTPIYGKEKIANEKPYKAILKDQIWYVSGSLPEAKAGEIIVGGVAEAEINKSDGRIIRISHGK
jgi:hypothetical protein